MYSKPVQKSPKDRQLPKGKSGEKKKPEGRANEFRVRSTFAAHDRTQLETVFDYPVVPSVGGRHRRQSYVVESWFFFPAQMGVTPQTYTKARFYADMRPLVRFREPRFTFKDLMGTNKQRSPLIVLRAYLKNVAEGKPTVSNQRAISEARIFGCSFASYFLKRIAKRTKALRKVHQYIATVYDDTGDGVETLIHYLEETRELLSKGAYLLKELRQLLLDAESMGHEDLKPIVAELRFVDEYCTYRLRDGLSTLMRIATEIDPRLVPQVDYHSFLRRCVAMNRLERWYARRRKYPWIDQTSTDDEVESYMYRRGILKRRIWSVLYLKIRSRPLFEFQRQLGAMAAAGLAALWWVVAMYYISQHGGDFLRAGFNGTASPNFWKSSGFLLVSASMLAYILKDRIKENSRSIFSGRLFKWIPDNSERILYEPPTGAPFEVGSVSEYAGFTPAESLPAEVQEIRRLSFVDALDADDSPKNIIHYRKVIDLFPKTIHTMDYPIRAVHDIFRINISGYLTRLDDPQAGTDILSNDGKISSLRLPKVYRMEIVLKHAVANPFHKQQQVTYDHFRLVLNKRGIIRIERM